MPPIVLLAGDPNRTKWIAKNFLDEPVCVADHRQMFGYRGFFKNIPIGVQTTGMGGPSTAIICEELKMLGARFLIRVGTCGGLDRRQREGDVFFVTSACMMDGTSRELFAAQSSGTGIVNGFAPTSDFEFLHAAISNAQAKSVRYHVGTVATVDRFYGHGRDTFEKLASFGILAVEMEASTVLTFAALNGMRAAAMMVISDNALDGTRADDEIIENGVRHMVDVALCAAIHVSSIDSDNRGKI